jgi:VWFA-related protein
MKRRSSLLALTLVAASAGWSALAQEMLDPHADQGDAEATGLTIAKRVDEVNLVFTVTDSRGRFISNLDASQLQFLDNHQPPQQIAYFQQQTNLPLRVALLIDLSDSIRGRFEFEKQAAGTFLKKILRPKVDQAFVVGFNDKAYLVQDMTGDVDQLADSIHKLESGGNTALYDAIILAANKLHSEVETRVTRRAIILISDGMDTASKAIMRDAEQAMAHAEAVMYVLSSNSPFEPYSKGEAVLELLSSPTGGRILPAHEKADLKTAFRDVEKTLRSQYAMGYKPAALQWDGGFRTIEIRPQKRGLKVRCRRGYFAPRQNLNR